MRRALFISILSLITSLGYSQLVEELKLNLGDGEGLRTFAKHIPNDSIQEIIFAFHDDVDPSWTPVTWCQELSWIASERSAAILVPIEPLGEIDSAMALKMVRLVSDSLTLDECSFIALGAGIGSARTFVDLGIDGLIMAPSDSLGQSSGAENGVYGIIDARSTDSATAIQADLIDQGAWTFRKLVIADHPYYFDHHKEVIRSLFQSMDSTRQFLSDTTVTLRSEIIKPGPEILRQGRPYEAELMVIDHGEFTIQLLNLSAELIADYSMVLGKGKQLISIPTSELEWGVYKVVIEGPEIKLRQKLMIRG